MHKTFLIYLPWRCYSNAVGIRYSASRSPTAQEPSRILEGQRVAASSSPPQPHLSCGTTYETRVCTPAAGMRTRLSSRLNRRRTFSPYRFNNDNYARSRNNRHARTLCTSFSPRTENRETVQCGLGRRLAQLISLDYRSPAVT